MAKRDKGTKAEGKRARRAAPATDETKVQASTLMPATCPNCAGAVSAIREQVEKTVDGDKRMVPGEAIGFTCQTESCAAYGVQQLFKESEDATAKARKAAGEKDEEEEDDLSDLPEILQEAIVAFGLKRDNVLDYKVSRKSSLSKKEDPTESVVLVTRGGRELVYPGDEAKAMRLTDSEKDGEQRAPTPRFFPGGLSPAGRGAIRG